MFSLTQPNSEAETGSVFIQIDSEDGEAIAHLTSVVTFKPKRGTIATETDATNYVVQSPTMVMFILRPEHAVYMDDEPEIQIEFPNAIRLSSTQCEQRDVELTGSTGIISPQCFRNQ